MAYRLNREEAVLTGLRRVVREELEAAAKQKMDAPGIHEARKAIKKVRAVIRLLGPSLGEAGARDNQTLRDAGRALSQQRDSSAAVETVETLLKKFPSGVSAEALSTLRSELQLASLPEAADASAAAVVAALNRTRRLVNFWRVPGNGFEVIETGLLRTYRQGRRHLALAIEEPGVERFHELRKRVKDHWYHIRLLELLRPQLLSSREASLKDLQECLGDDHNLAILETKIGPGSSILPLIEQARSELRANAVAIASRLYRQKPRAYVRRMREVWDAGRAEPLPRRRPISVPAKRAQFAPRSA